MYYNSSVVGLILVFGLLISCNKEVKEASIPEGALIEAETLLALKDHSKIKIIDFRKEAAYKAGHIAGALTIWRTQLEDTSYHYKGMMPTKNTIEALFSDLGIKNDDVLVAYDDRGGCDAARLWWVLKNYNVHTTKILNGGLQAWKAIEGSISTDIKAITPSQYKLSPEPPFNLLIHKDDLLARLQTSDNNYIVDTRGEEEHSGEVTKNGAAKGGRIPTSMRINWVEAIDYEGSYKMKPVAELEKIYSRLGAEKTDTIIVYCHSGVRSAYTTFVLTEILGYKNVKNYDGSWTEWSHFDELPFENDVILIVK
jgi:thiosulfate/3-mercaptopyruvate sulfurtransferase